MFYLSRFPVIGLTCFVTSLYFFSSFFSFFSPFFGRFPVIGLPCFVTSLYVFFIMFFVFYYRVAHFDGMYSATVEAAIV